MNTQNMRTVDALRSSGWRVELLASPAPLPEALVERYPWVPAEFRDLAESVKCLCGPDDKAWVLTSADYAGTSDSAYAWNEWERQSLEAAGSDEDWSQRIEEFWDSHLPILLSLLLPPLLPFLAPILPILLALLLPILTVGPILSVLALRHGGAPRVSALGGLLAALAAEALAPRAA